MFISCFVSVKASFWGFLWFLSRSLVKSQVWHYYTCVTEFYEKKPWTQIIHKMSWIPYLSIHLSGINSFINCLFSISSISCFLLTTVVNNIDTSYFKKSVVLLPWLLHLAGLKKNIMESPHSLSLSTGVIIEVGLIFIKDCFSLPCPCFLCANSQSSPKSSAQPQVSLASSASYGIYNFPLFSRWQW